MKKLLFAIFTISIFISCKKEKIQEIDISNVLNELSIRESKIYFAKTLANAVSKEPSLRSFIRTEALKQFDHDYDVFYHSVRNVTLDNGESFEQKLIKYATSKDSLNIAIKTLPLLTILVPEIGDISAETWDDVTEIPLVAIEPKSYSSKENIKAFLGQDKTFEIPYGSVPGTISLVVKDNERVVLTSGGSSYAKSSTKNAVMSIGSTKIEKSNSFLSSEGIVFSFADPVFNNIEKVSVSRDVNNYKLMGPRPPRKGTGVIPGYYTGADSWKNDNYASTTTVQHIIDAVTSGAEWQRDNVYYGLNPSAGITQGPLKPLIKECLTSIKFQTPAETHGTIGQNPGDPQPVDGTRIAQEWTNGSYEFRLTALINTKSGAGAQVQQTFYIKPQDLFILEYTVSQAYPGAPVTMYSPVVKQARLYKFATPIPIYQWDLNDTSVSWGIYLLKYNNQATTTQTVTTTNTYAANFEFSQPLGANVKVGFKFGMSATTSNTQTYVVSRTYGSSDFGNAIISYSDPIYRSYTIRSDGYTTYEANPIYVGPAILTIEPRKM